MSLAIGGAFLDFELDGRWTRNLRAEGPLLIVFWKVACPVCRMALPFFQRIQNTYPGALVMGVVQDERGAIRQACQELELKFLQTSDANLSVTRAYDLKVVPTYVLTDKSGKVVQAGVSWDRAKIEDVSGAIARLLHATQIPIIRTTDDVPAFRPG